MLSITLAILTSEPASSRGFLLNLCLKAGMQTSLISLSSTLTLPLKAAFALADRNKVNSPLSPSVPSSRHMLAHFFIVLCEEGIVFINFLAC